MTPAQSITPRWLRLSSAASYCGLNEKTLRRRIADGSIASKLVKAEGSQRGVRVIDRITLDAFIEGSSDEMVDLKMNKKNGLDQCPPPSIAS